MVLVYAHFAVPKAQKTTRSTCSSFYIIVLKPVTIVIIRALIHLGSRYKNGQKGLPQDIVKAEDRNINKRTILMTLTQLCVLLICIAITILIRRKRR